MGLDDLVLTGDFATVHDVVLQYAPVFAAHGFAFKGVALQGSAELVRFPVFHFLNDQSNLRIDISFISAAGGLNGGFTAMIIKPVNQKLDVEDYLKAHDREAFTRFFTYRDPATDVRRFADTFFQLITGLLDRDLKPILEGRTFEETPVDWMGYK